MRTAWGEGGLGSFYKGFFSQFLGQRFFETQFVGWNRDKSLILFL